MSAPQNDQHADGPLALLRRLSRTQKVIVGAAVVGIVLVVTVRIFGAGTSLGDRTHRLAAGLQVLLFLAGGLLLWLVVSWRLARFPITGLIGSLAVTGALALLFSHSPVTTLIGWIAIVVLATTYLHFWRKGRVGFTRGASAALFSNIAVICSVAGIPLALIAVLSGTGAPPRQPTTTLPTAAPDLPYYQGEGMLALGRTPGWHIVDDGRIEVVTDATSRADLRALFDAQRGNVRGHVAADDAKLWRVRIRCASVPDLPGVDPTLATGRFVTSGTAGTYTVDQLQVMAEEYVDAGDHGSAEWAVTYAGVLDAAGLTASDDAQFELADRSDCEPLPPPANAVTGEEVIAAAQQAGLDITNPRDRSGLCHELRCLRRTVTDQVTIIVWPTTQAARDWVRVPTINGVLFGPVTTEQLNGELASAGAPPFGDEEGRRYEDGLASVAATLEPSR